ncbi:MAG TPA: mycothiol system anti-sigma-R factor [bacterium]|nr:mycothiol system anti-sigma-R factor [bacterium]
MAELDCEQVLEQVWSYLDGELSEDAYLEIQAHVAECEGCGSKYDFQRRLIELIERKCREGPIPAELKQRLFRLLDSESPPARSPG